MSTVTLLFNRPQAVQPVKDELSLGTSHAFERDPRMTRPMTTIYSEAEILARPAALAEAWDAAPFVLVVPEPCSVSRPWLDGVVGQLPAHLRDGHFGVLTSGSTGVPKLVIGSKSRSRALAAELHRRQDLAPVGTALLALPLAYSYSLINQWLWSHVHERRFLVTRGLADPAALLVALDEADNSMLCLVGSQVPLLRRYVPSGRTFPRVIRLNFAGGPFPQKELPWIRETFPASQIYHNYGCTEAMPRLTIRPAESSQEAMVLGAPLSGIQLRVTAEGWLQFTSPYGALAIADDQGVRSFGEHEWIDTGDLAEARPDGSYFLLGRRSEVFKRHGEKVSLPALAAALGERWTGQIAFLLETAPDGETGHVAVLAPAPDQTELRLMLLSLRRRFRRPLWPIRLDSLPVMPTSANGKPDLQALRSLPRTILWKQII